MCPCSEAPKGITWASIVSFLLLWWLDDNKMTHDLSRGDTTQYFTAQWLEIGQILIHRQLRHVHRSLKLQSMLHFVNSIALSRVLFESSVLIIFRAEKTDCTVQQLMKQSQAVWNKIFYMNYSLSVLLLQKLLDMAFMEKFLSKLIFQGWLTSKLFTF